MIREIEKDNFRKNIYKISAIGRFNTEKLLVIQKYYNFAYRNKSLFQKIVSLEDIREFCINNEKVGKFFEDSLIFDFVLALSMEEIDFEYINERYGHLIEPFKRIYGFDPNTVSLIRMKFEE